MMYACTDLKIKKTYLWNKCLSLNKRIWTNILEVLRLDQTNKVDCVKTPVSKFHNEKCKIFAPPGCHEGVGSRPMDVTWSSCHVTLFLAKMTTGVSTYAVSTVYLCSVLFVLFNVYVDSQDIDAQVRRSTKSNSYIAKGLQ